MQYFLGHSGVENCSIDKVHRNVLAIHRIPTNIAGRVYQLAKVLLVILHSDEANKMCPGRHVVIV